MSCRGLALLGGRVYRFGLPRGLPMLPAMDGPGESYLTTRELADLLRIKERKVYDLAAAGEVPCVRVVGKLLFPQADVRAWIEGARSGPAAEGALPGVMLGSHDPLLDWALRESGSGLAAFLDGSADGLARFARREGVACGVHIHEEDGWNVESVAAAVGEAPVVLLELARRRRGLIVAPQNPLEINGLADLAGRRVARRQEGAASQGMFDALSAGAGLGHLDGPEAVARTEGDVAMLVFEGKADAAFGLEAVAAQMRLGFVPVLEERFDLLVWRRAYFEPAVQRLMAFLRSPACAAKAAEMRGYDLSGLGTVWLNGAR
mgnify:CR=1 FL=1